MGGAWVVDAEAQAFNPSQVLPPGFTAVLIAGLAAITAAQAASSAIGKVALNIPVLVQQVATQASQTTQTLYAGVANLSWTALQAAYGAVRQAAAVVTSGNFPNSWTFNTVTLGTTSGGQTMTIDISECHYGDGNPGCAYPRPTWFWYINIANNLLGSCIIQASNGGTQAAFSGSCGTMGIGSGSLPSNFSSMTASQQLDAALQAGADQAVQYGQTQVATSNAQALGQTDTQIPPMPGSIVYPWYDGTGNMPATVDQAASDTRWASGEWGQVNNKLQAGLSGSAAPASEGDLATKGYVMTPSVTGEAGGSTSTDVQATGLLADILKAILGFPAAIWKAFEDEVGKLFSPNLVNAQTQVNAVEAAFANRVPIVLVTFAAGVLNAIPAPSSTGSCTPPQLNWTFGFGPAGNAPWSPDFSFVCTIAGVVRPVMTTMFVVGAAWELLMITWPRLTL